MRVTFKGFRVTAPRPALLILSLMLLALAPRAVFGQG
jgi:hypothetical protein